MLAGCLATLVLVLACGCTRAGEGTSARSLGEPGSGSPAASAAADVESAAPGTIPGAPASQRAGAHPAVSSGIMGCTFDSAVPEVVRFGVTPYVGAEIVTRQFEPILAHLARSTGLKFTMVLVKDYEDLLGAILDGRADVASLSPLLYVEAKEKQPCLQLLAMQVSLGATFYSSYVLVQEDAPFQSVEELRGKRFAFGSMSSASGYLFPLAFLLDRGIVPEEFFSQVRYGKDHLDALRMMVRREVDGVATFARVLQPARAAGLDVSNLRVLAVTGRVPFDGVCARAGFPEESAALVRKGLLELNGATQEGRQVLAGVIDMGGWVATEDSVYDPVRERLGRVRERESR